jgi:acyl-CoA synthetase (NDP forming)
MELLLPIGHALIERPPLRGSRIAIITMGGSWGVALSDMLEEEGLVVPEFSLHLQKALRSLGMPARASTRNPVDYGTSGLFLSVKALIALGREILYSGEVDALILHGIGRPGMHTEDTPAASQLVKEVEVQQIRGLHELERELGLPVIIGSHFTPMESQSLNDINKQGIRTYANLRETAQMLALMHADWRNRSVRGGNLS